MSADPRNEPPTWREFTHTLTWAIAQLFVYVTIITILLLVIVVYA